MTYLIARYSDLFVVGNSQNNDASVISFDHCAWNGAMKTEELSWRIRGIVIRGPRSYTVQQAYSELQPTVHYAEMNDVHITPSQRQAWSLDPQVEW